MNSTMEPAPVVGGRFMQASCTEHMDFVVNALNQSAEATGSEENSMEKLNGKMEFFYQFDEGHPAIRVTLPPSSGLSEVFESFEGFLRAAGYHFEGIVDITNEDNTAKQDENAELN